MFSQSNEDEIIADIFAIIGVGDKSFVEFGCGDGRQNNTIALLHQGWSGTWLDPHRKRVMSARARWMNYPVDIIRRIVTPNNVNKVVPDDLDFLSIDIDGNDYAVWQAITANPRVVCIEYDAVNGSSLQAMISLAGSKEYGFARCSASHVNAFFVHRLA